MTNSGARALQEADLEHALGGLEHAAAAAEGRHATLVAAPPDAFRVLAARDMKFVRDRLDRVVMGADPEAGLDALLAVGALEAIFPEVSSMVGFSDAEWRHKDVWKHTKQVVRQAVPRLEVRWGALFHDIGKVKTRSIGADGKVHFFGHAEVGTRMFDKLERRMPLFTSEPTLKNTVRFLILHHLRPNQYDASWTDSAVRRFARELGEHLDDLLCLARADITTKRPEKKKRGLSNISELAERIRKLREEDAKIPPLPSGVGDAIMKAFQLKPSRLIGDIKKSLEAEIASGALAAHEPADFYIAHLEKDRAKYGL